MYWYRLSIMPSYMYLFYNIIHLLVSKKAKSDTWPIFFRLYVVLQIKIKSTKCRTWPFFFSTSIRIRRVVKFDERVFDEKSCIDLLRRNQVLQQWSTPLSAIKQM